MRNGFWLAVGTKQNTRILLILLIFEKIVGWGKESVSVATNSSSPYDNSNNVSIKHQLINLISATRTLMRSTLNEN